MTTSHLVERTITDFEELYDPTLIGRTVSISFTNGYDETGRLSSESSLGVVEGVTRVEDSYYVKLSGREVIRFNYSETDEEYAPSFTLSVYRPGSSVGLC